MNFEVLRLLRILRPVTGDMLRFDGHAFTNTPVPSALTVFETPTIASGVVTIASSTALVVHLSIDTQAAAASDDLDTLSGGADGQIAILTAANAARTVVVKDSTDNLRTAGDHSMDHAQDTTTLIRMSSVWFELARANNNT